MGTNLQLCAVGGKSAAERRGHTGTQVAADDRCAHETNLRFLLAEEVDKDFGVWDAGVREKSLCVEHIEFIHTEGQYLLLHFTLDSRTSHYGLEFHTQRVGQLAALCQQFLRYILYLCAFYLAINKYVVHISYPIIFSFINS